NGLSSHRRDALWQIENRNEVSELFSWGNRQQSVKESPPSTIPLARMNFTERLSEDYKGLGLTTDQHPMMALRHQLSDTWRASDLKQGKHGDKINVAGMV